MSKDKHDPVNRPSHYTHGEIECIDAIRAMMSASEFTAFCRGNVVKYAWRVGRKGSSVEDLRKCAWYASKAADVIEGESGT